MVTKKIRKNVEKNFTHDLEFGEMWEDELKDILENKKLEIKTERGIWVNSGNLAIEISCAGKPSGLRTTQAEHWMHLLEYEGGLFATIMVETAILKKVIQKMVDSKKAKIIMGGDDNESELVLVPMGELFKRNNNYAREVLA